jgi:hypothetical protein
VLVPLHDLLLYRPFFVVGGEHEVDDVAVSHYGVAPKHFFLVH